ncbi:MAG: non-heme iron oxygenase ferredoxin subunit [Pseudomonadales bacterium]
MPMTALADGDMAACRVGGEEILVANVQGQYYAVSNFCSHAGQRLSTGRLDGHELHCPLHRASFDVRTGAALSRPASEALKRYTVVLQDGKIQILLGGGDSRG